MLMKDIINNLDEEGFTLLHWNAKEGNAEIVQKLIDKGANIEIKDKENGSTPLLWACQNGHTNVVKILLQNRANLFAFSKSGNTGLHFAVESGNIELVEMLVKKGLDIDAKDEYGFTPLLFACQNGHIDVAKILLQYGANIRAASYNGATALHYATESGNINLIEMVLKEGLNVNATNNQGMTSLHKAVKKRHIDIVKLLIENGANIFAKTKAKNSNCLLLASQKGHVEMMKLLIEKGLDINSKDIDGSTPFLITCLYGQAKAAQFLLRNGANIEDVNKHSYNGLNTTAFLDGKYANLREITKLLLTNGADVTVKKKEMSAFHLALKRRNFHFIKALFDHRPTFDIKDSRNENVIEHVLRRNEQNIMRIIAFHFHSCDQHLA